jgi:hypothetical protein
MRGRTNQTKRITAAVVTAIQCVVVLFACLPVMGQGLHGYYYKFGFGKWTEPFSVDHTIDRVDSTLDFFWDGEVTPEITSTSAMSVRWFGMITPPETGDYVFQLVADEGARLLVDGEVLVDALYRRIQIPYQSRTVSLTAGTEHEIAIELMNIHPSCGIILSWRKPGATEFEVIPASVLSPDLTTGTAPVAAPIVTPTEIAFTTNTNVELSTTTDGAVIYYTLDGAEPSRIRGHLYVHPITITETSTLKARAFKAGMAASEETQVSYTMDVTLAEGVHTWRSGNSLTAGVVGTLPSVAASGGYDHDAVRHTSPGAPTRYLWEHFDQDDSLRLASNAPYDYYITQPFAEDSIEREVEMTGNFFDEVLAVSPEADLVIYQQWVGYDIGKLLGPNLHQSTSTPEQWAADMVDYVQWFEELRDSLQAAYPGKTVTIIPCGLAFMKLKEEIDAGRVPGITEFISTTIRDGIHPTYSGYYLAALVHYVCLYKKDPRGIVAPNTSLSWEQQRIYQEIAWQTVTTYEYSGFNPTGVASARQPLRVLPQAKGTGRNLVAFRPDGRVIRLGTTATGLIRSGDLAPGLLLWRGDGGRGNARMVQLR